MQAPHIFSIFPKIYWSLSFIIQHFPKFIFNEICSKRFLFFFVMFYVSLLVLWSLLPLPFIFVCLINSVVLNKISLSYCSCNMSELSLQQHIQQKKLLRKLNQIINIQKWITQQSWIIRNESIFEWFVIYHFQFVTLNIETAQK